MNRLLVLLLVISTLNCSPETANEETSAATTETQPGDIPGIKTTYDDTPGLVKTEVRDASDRLTASGYILDGKREGSWIEYTPTGMIRTLTTYVRGKKEGVYLEYNEMNQLWKRCFFHNDKRHGEYIEYLNTIKKEIRYYENGKIEGASTIYYDNSDKIMEASFYKNGLRDGVAKWFDQNGNVTIEYEYKNGELVKK